MNLQQLEYIRAVDNHRHFVKAAEACFVTQATLSMMIKKLEQELDIIIFDRSKQPVTPTEAGRKVIEQARVVLKETQMMKDLSGGLRTEMEGELRIGIIPTIAPYLLPLLLPNFLKKYPAIRLKIQEQTTDQLVKFLSSDKIDIAIMATPLAEPNLRETHVFFEEFRVFVAATDQKLKKKFLLPEDIDVNRLWLLEEGHCLRSQALSLCELQKRQVRAQNLDYETGSIESLIKITEISKGITIVPELATLGFNKKQKDCLRQFRPPVPVREVSLVTYRHFAKEKMLDILKTAIIQAVKPWLSQGGKENKVIGI
jgi:LysR family transcriptional regulator, hydrogen peroxide-inducible genes activator